MDADAWRGRGRHPAYEEPAAALSLRRPGQKLEGHSATRKVHVRLDSRWSS